MSEVKEDLEIEDPEVSEQKRIIELYREVFAGPVAAELLEHLAAECHFTDGTFCREPNEMYFKEGERSVFNRIIERLDLPLVNIRTILENSRTTYSGDGEE